MKKPPQRTALPDLAEEIALHDGPKPAAEKPKLQLYLVRHARSDGHVGDVTRTLSEEARARFRKTARVLAQHCKGLDLILTSALVRAVQTSELLAAELGHGHVEVLEELSPEYSASELLDALTLRCKGHKRIALVGHKPSLVHLLNKLAGAGEELHFHNGAIVRLDVSSLPEPKVTQGRYWISASAAKKHKGLPRR